MVSYSLLTLLRKREMQELSPKSLYERIEKAAQDGAVKITFDFKENHKNRIYPTGPVYTVPNLDAIPHKEDTIYRWVHSAYINGCAYCRIVFGYTPIDGEEYIPSENFR